jgi:hypothetical protein
MNALAAVLPSVATRRNMLAWLGAIAARQPVLAGAAVLVGASIIPMAFAGAVDTRLFNGIDIWIKPTKFAVSVLVYMATMVFFAAWVADSTRRARWFRALAWVVAAAGVLEIFYIALQASRGEASHFNQADTLHYALYALMGLGATSMVAFSGLLGILIARNPAVGVPPAIREAVVIGLVLAFVLTMVTAGTMSSLGSHWIGGVHSDAGGMTLMGWARGGGDLRVAHFFATHAMQFIPLFGVLSAMALGPRNRWPIWLFAAAFTGFVGFLLVQALLGQPFLPVVK